MYYWLSFCDDTLPTGETFVGGCIVRANSIAVAIQEAWRLRCNPGGEVMGYPIPQDLWYRIKEERIGILWTKEECHAFEKQYEAENEAWVIANSEQELEYQIICPEHNARTN